MDARPAATQIEPVLSLDEDHRYWLINPAPIPPENLWGVTQVMVDNRLESDDYYTEEHSSRGIALHAELSNIALGGKPFPFLDPDLVGWRYSGVSFLDELEAEGAKIIGVEVMRWHPIYRFAGRIDLVVSNWRGYDWILDWKSGPASKVTRFKLAAYDLLLGPTTNGKQRKKAAIEIHRDGRRAKPVEYNTSAHFHDGNRFLSYLNTSRDRKEFGPK